MFTGAAWLFTGAWEQILSARVQVLAQLLERPAVAAVAASLAWDLSPGAGQHLVQQTLWALQVTGPPVTSLLSDTCDGH